MTIGKAISEVAFMLLVGFLVVIHCAPSTTECVTACAPRDMRAYSLYHCECADHPVGKVEK